MTPRILVVDDDETTQLLLETHLANDGYQVSLAGSARDMNQALLNGETDALVLDLHLPDGDGIELIDKVQAVQPDLPVIIITAYGSVEKAVEAMRRGAYDFCTKPVELNRLSVAVHNAIERAHLKQKVEKLEKARRSGLCDLIGGSPEMQVVYHIIETVAPTKASVLITGESGTGKELIARAIHQISNRRSQPLVDVNCAAIPKDLLESELFGHEKSAFTGANRQYMGRCEQADQGTLFLDEVAEMDINLQPKLLRFLQERYFYRVGGKQKIQVDIRVVSATNKDPMEAIQSARLREDLYYRLNVVNIQVPPLRDRIEDIPDLARVFLQRYAKENEKDFRSLSPQAEDALCSYAWPGNVRELENCIQHALILHTGSVLDRHMLPEPISAMGPLEIRPRTEEPIPEQPSLPFSSDVIIPLETLERHAIEQALRITQGNVSKAASGLRLSQATLYRKIRDYGFLPKNYKTGGDGRDEEDPPEEM